MPSWQNYSYLALDNVAYMFDDCLMLAAVTATLSKTRLQERGGRWLKLISGVAILLLGCSWGNSMLQPTDPPPTSFAPRLAASIRPGPPPVITVNPDCASWMCERVTECGKPAHIAQTQEQ